MFVEKVTPILDLYQGRWQGQPLGPHDHVLSADEKTGIQARCREHPSLQPASARPALIEHEHEGAGAWTYLAALDVHRAKVFGHCVIKNGILPFNGLIEKVMSQEPYRSATRVFRIIDNAHLAAATSVFNVCKPAGLRLFLSTRPSTPVWLNQIETYFSIVQRKVLTPNDFDSLAKLETAPARLPGSP